MSGYFLKKAFKKEGDFLENWLSPYKDGQFLQSVFKLESRLEIPWGEIEMMTKYRNNEML